MALIDDYVPIPHYTERHSTIVRAPARAVIEAAAAYRTESDPFFAGMMALREWPMQARRRLRRDAVEHASPFGLDRFALLDRDEREIVLGLAGRFWRPDFGLLPVQDGQAFRALSEPGISKLALNFTVLGERAGATLLSTETRVFCTDRAAGLRFAPYWYLIRPVSGLIRRRMLGIVRRTCETQATPVPA